MARGYIIASVSVSNPHAYQAYVATATQALAQLGGTALVRGGRYETLEGEGRTRNIVLEFASYEEARDYYYSPQYQQALQQRHGIALANVTVVEGA